MLQCTAERHSDAADAPRCCEVRVHAPRLRRTGLLRPPGSGRVACAAPAAAPPRRPSRGSASARPHFPQPHARLQRRARCMERRSLRQGWPPSAQLLCARLRLRRGRARSALRRPLSIAPRPHRSRGRAPCQTRPTPTAERSAAMAGSSLWRRRAGRCDSSRAHAGVRAGRCDSSRAHAGVRADRCDSSRERAAPKRALVSASKRTRGRPLNQHAAKLLPSLEQAYVALRGAAWSKRQEVNILHNRQRTAAPRTHRFSKQATAAAAATAAVGAVAAGCIRAVEGRWLTASACQLAIVRVDQQPAAIIVSIANDAACGRNNGGLLADVRTTTHDAWLLLKLVTQHDVVGGTAAAATAAAADATAVVACAC
eukprot:364003-Chlamydomonas_euryale.AAC.27